MEPGVVDDKIKDYAQRYDVSEDVMRRLFEIGAIR